MKIDKETEGTVLYLIRIEAIQRGAGRAECEILRRQIAASTRVGRGAPWRRVSQLRSVEDNAFPRQQHWLLSPSNAKFDRVLLTRPPPLPPSV